MRRSLLGLALLLLQGSSPLSLGPWLHNPRERTAHALDAYQEGAADRAVPYAEQALALAPQDARTQYNAGTVHLAAGQGPVALTELEQSVESLRRQAEETGVASPLAPDASYNLGNARFGAGDTAGAVESFKQALRLRPDFSDAKHNLEIALRRLEEEQQQSQSEENPEENPEQGDQGPEPESTPPEDEPPQEGQPDSDTPPQPNPQEQPPPEERFEEQPDMSAEEAAAILEAVENLERQQRQEQAAQRARQASSEEKDW